MNYDDLQISNVLSKISTWNKWDLHIHTPSTNMMVQNDYKNPELFSEKLFVSKMYDNDIKLSVLTDHNIFDSEQFKRISKEVLKRNKMESKYLCLLPGVEINVDFPNPQDDAIHFILIFDNNENLDNISKAVEQLNLKIGYTRGNPKNATVEQIADNFSEFDYIVSIHLGKSSNVPRDNNYDEFLKLYIGGFINICENNPANKIKNKEYLEERIKEITEEKKDSIYIVASDNHNISKYPLCENIVTKPKISFYKAIPSFEGLKMVITEPTRIHNSENDCPPGYVSLDNDITKIEAIRIESPNIETEDIYFGRELNSIIGARTSGKSLLINILKYALTGNYNEKKYEDYIKDLKISVKTFDDDDFKTNSSVQLEVFDQNRLMEELESSKEEKDFFKDTYIAKLFSELSIDNNLVLESFKDEIKKENIFLIELEVFKNLIDAFKIPNVYMKKYVNMGRDVNDLSKFYLSIDSMKKFEQTLTLNNAKQSYLETSISSIDKVIDDDKYSILSKEDKIMLLSIKEHLYKNLIKVRKNVMILNEIKKVDISEFKPIKVDAKFVEGHANFISLVSKIAKTKSKLDKISIDSSLFKNRKFKVNGEQRYEKTKLIHDFTFKCSVDYDVNFYSKTDEQQHIVEKRFYADDIRLGWAGLINKIMIKGLVKDSLFKSGGVNEIIQDILKEIPKPNKTIIDSKGVDINETSPGNRASILITVILENNENKILIIDQPEDNLDSKFIYDEIVDKRLKNLKKTRQIFIVTHNANIVVNSDSENIICCKNNDNKISYQHGAIEYLGNIFDGASMKEFILDTLEGGKKAFKVRNGKYFLKGVE